MPTAPAGALTFKSISIPVMNYGVLGLAQTHLGGFSRIAPDPAKCDACIVDPAGLEFITQVPPLTRAPTNLMKAK
jgi:hypothetical protein